MQHHYKLLKLGIVGLTLVLAGCGKRGAPQAVDCGQEAYPTTYPTE